MYEDIKINKIKTGVIVTLFFTLITCLIYFICYMCNFGEYALFFAVIFSIVSTLITYYNCDKIVLASVDARKTTREEDLQLSNILDDLMVASGLTHKPDLYVINSMQPNAFATGRDPEHSIICVTQGLLDKLEYYELEGVVAHELSHIKNYDIRLNAIISVMVGFVIIISRMFTRGFFRGSRGRKNDRDSGSIQMILFLVGLIFLILSPIATKLIQLAVSRRREYLADATAVSFTRNPDGLISALVKISGDNTEMEDANSSTAHMFFASPFNKERKEKVSSFFSTHPSLEERVNAIKNLK